MRQRMLALGALVLVAVVSFVGCLVVTPMDEYEADSSTAAGGSGGGTSTSSGASGGGGSQSEGSEESASVGTTGQDKACTSNAECIEGANGHPSRCADGDCTLLRSGTCTQVYPETYKPENPIYIGAFARLPESQPELSSALFAFRLALGEISGDSYGGLLLPDGEGDTERRPLVLVACDNSSQANIDAGAEHLIHDVGVSAILATLLPGELRQLFETYKESGVFWLSPVGATETVADLDDQGLVWSMLGQPKNLVPVYRDLVQDLVEPYIREVRGAGDAPLKLVLFGGEDAFSQELSSLVNDALRWNGKSTSENLKEENFQGYSLNAETDLKSTVQKVIDFVPDIIVSTAGEMVTRDVTGLVYDIEASWDGDTSEPRPFYVLSPFNGGDLDAIITEFDTWREYDVDPYPERRLVGVHAAGAEDPKLQNDYAVNLTNAFGDDDPTLDTGNYYDAFYFLAYAIYAAQKQNPTGADIANGMQRLLEGQVYHVGFQDIADITEQLADATTKIRLDGTVGPPNFDSDGVRIDPGAVYCLDGSTMKLRSTPNALRYDPETKSFFGNFTCFPNFAP